MKNTAIIFSFSLLALFSCQGEKEVSEEITETVSEEFPQSMGMPVTGDNSRTSLDWNGTYSGTLPCADCEGIETSLMLEFDGTYTLTTRYLGKENEANTTQGSFTWDESGSTISIEGGQSYRIGENRIWHLDKEGNRIEGDLAELYILTKQ